MVHLLPSIVLENTRSVLVMKEISVCRLFRVSLQRAHRSLSLYSGGDRWRLIATVSIYKFQKNVAGKESSLLRPRMKIRSRVIEHCCDSVTSRVVLSLAYIFTGKKSCSIRFVYKKLTRYVFFILSKNPRVYILEKSNIFFFFFNNHKPLAQRGVWIYLSLAFYVEIPPT